MDAPVDPVHAGIWPGLPGQLPKPETAERGHRSSCRQRYGGYPADLRRGHIRRHHEWHRDDQGNSDNIITILPAQAGHYMSLITALLSVPFTHVLTNDAFYFGVLPVLAATAAHYGSGPNEMAIASLVGQPVHLLSPLVASTSESP